MIDKFFENVEKIPEAGCWLWIGASLDTGYGTFKGGSDKELAHRFSWKVHNGPIPEGMYVLHKCDVRCCVNPNHLFLGNQYQNLADMTNKGRRVSFPGEIHWNSKLTWDDVKEIRRLWDNNIKSQTEIAKGYSVDRKNISSICTRRTWKETS